jgi:hypothetical protein
MALIHFGTSGLRPSGILGFSNFLSPKWSMSKLTTFFPLVRSDGSTFPFQIDDQHLILN